MKVNSLRKSSLRITTLQMIFRWTTPSIELLSFRFSALEGATFQATWRQWGKFRAVIWYVVHLCNHLLQKSASFSLEKKWQTWLSRGKIFPYQPCMVYLLTCLHLVGFYGFHIGKYTIVPWMRHGITYHLHATFSMQVCYPGGVPSECHNTRKKGLIITPLKTTMTLENAPIFQ